MSYTSKFKIGDRVRIVAADPPVYDSEDEINDTPFVGEVGVVKEINTIDSLFPITVQFEPWVERDCTEYLERDCTEYLERELVLLEEPEDEELYI